MKRHGNNSHQAQRQARNCQGAGVIVLVLLLGFFIIGVVGLFGFEITRNISARDELRSACEAAALAGAAALASSNQTLPQNAHDDAETAAQQAFVVNSILGNLLSNTTFSDNRNGTRTAATAAHGTNPDSNCATMFVEFLNLNGQPVPWSNFAGRTCHVVGVFGEEPAFGKYVGITKANVWAEAKAAVPKMDLVLCFDCSSSMDDQTKITLVKKWMSGGTARYDIVAEGTIAQVFNAPPVGTGINAEKPEGLDRRGTYSFNKNLRVGSANGDQGAPPGGGQGGPTDFTDLVVNLDGNNHFGGTTYSFNNQSWSFPDLASLVEASRGNLESAAYLSSAQGNTRATPASGYQAAYWAAAHEKAEPISSARQAALTFYRIMNNNTNAEFGFVSFSTRETHTLGTFGSSENAIANNYAGQGQVDPAFNGLALAPGNYNRIVNTVVPNTVAYGRTNIAGALQEAVNELTGPNRRTDAIPAIVFFTDGQPNTGGSWTSAARQANGAGIAIYAVGMAQTARIIPGEVDNLNDQQGPPFTPIQYIDPITQQQGQYTPTQQGMSAVAGHGGKFFLVTNVNNLNFVFENIARQLVQLAKN
jgi:Flp pilus assembly protein TadG